MSLGRQTILIPYWCGKLAEQLEEPGICECAVSIKVR